MLLRRDALNALTFTGVIGSCMAARLPAWIIIKCTTQTLTHVAFNLIWSSLTADFIMFNNFPAYVSSVDAESYVWEQISI